LYTLCVLGCAFLRFNEVNLLYILKKNQSL
jgi:hypothetical protein